MKMAEPEFVAMPVEELGRTGGVPAVRAKKKRTHVRPCVPLESLLVGKDKMCCSSPQLLGKYTIHGKLDQGTFGEIGLATRTGGSPKDSTGLSELVVVKKVDKSKCNMERLKAEMEAGTVLQHKGLAHFRETFDSEKEAYFVLDYIAGKTLFTMLEERQFVPMPAEDVKHLFIQMVEAVQYCHRNGFVHRDLKLENVMVTQFKEVKIIDFGLCNRFSEGGQLTDCVGSPDYVSPEVMKTKPYCGHRLDVWSLGTILFILLCGEFPWTRMERIMAIVEGSHPPLSFPNGIDIPEPAKDLLNGMLEKDTTKSLSLDAVRDHPWLAV